MPFSVRALSIFMIRLSEHFILAAAQEKGLNHHFELGKDEQA